MIKEKYKNLLLADLIMGTSKWQASNLLVAQNFRNYQAFVSSFQVLNIDSPFDTNHYNVIPKPKSWNDKLEN